MGKSEKMELLRAHEKERTYAKRRVGGRGGTVRGLVHGAYTHRRQEHRSRLVAEFGAFLAYGGYAFRLRVQETNAPTEKIEQKQSYFYQRT